MTTVSTAELLHVLHYRDTPENLPDLLNKGCKWDGTVYGMVDMPGCEAAQLGDEKHENVLYFAPSVGEEDRRKLAGQRHLRVSEPNNRPARDWRNALGEVNSARERGNNERAETPKAAPVGLPLPPLLRTCSVFFVSAWNPKGRTRHMEDNLKATSLLRKDLAALKNGELKAKAWPSKSNDLDILTASAPKPQAIWEGFDWNLAQGWRVEGFCLAYTKPFAAQGREAVMALARKHGQNMVVEYEPLPCEFQGDPGRMTRRGVSFVADFQQESTDVTQMVNLARTWPSEKVTVVRVAQPTWPAPK
mmetsp:Transcript_43785/g.103065  ORF Transcript_43785/g.103065 Transcript_43785/m.103065 type:complete len:304 (-) Transcript_43785:354-1265(-)